MKIYQLLEMIKGRSLNDDLLIPCGEGQLTDNLQVRPINVGPGVENSRHVALFPIEGDWSAHAGRWEKKVVD